jgi:FemAB-related protein (PEP-CTERM system-associated)
MSAIGDAVALESAARQDTPMVRSSILVRDDPTSSGITSYLARTPTATLYHDPKWLPVLRQAFGRRGTYLSAIRGGDVVGVLPLVFFSHAVFGRFAVSMPFLNYGGVIADDAAVEAALLERAMAETRRAGGTHLELRHTRQHFASLTPKRHKVAMMLDLATSEQAEWDRLDRKVRNQVRKAEKHGLSVAVGGAELLPSFYGVFARNMRDLGTPVYGPAFFRAVLAAFPAQTRVFVVSRGDTPLAASIVLGHRRTVEVPWASALRESNSLSANVFLYWHMLKEAIASGAERFDFGRSTPGEGTFQFKKQWGSQPVELVWEYWMANGGAAPDLSPKNDKFALAIRAWQRLPLRIASALGPSIVRHIP